MVCVFKTTPIFHSLVCVIPDIQVNFVLWQSTSALIRHALMAAFAHQLKMDSIARVPAIFTGQDVNLEDLLVTASK